MKKRITLEDLLPYRLCKIPIIYNYEWFPEHGSREISPPDPVSDIPLESIPKACDYINAGFTPKILTQKEYNDGKILKDTEYSEIHLRNPKDLTKEEWEYVFGTEIYVLDEDNGGIIYYNDVDGMKLFCSIYDDGLYFHSSNKAGELYTINPQYILIRLWEMGVDTSGLINRGVAMQQNKQ